MRLGEFGQVVILLHYGFASLAWLGMLKLSRGARGTLFCTEGVLYDAS